MGYNLAHMEMLYDCRVLARSVSPDWSFRRPPVPCSQVWRKKAGFVIGKCLRLLLGAHDRKNEGATDRAAGEVFATSVHNVAEFY